MSFTNGTMNDTLQYYAPTPIQGGMFGITEALYMVVLILAIIYLRKMSGKHGWTTPRLFCFLLCVVLPTRMLFFVFYYLDDYTFVDVAEDLAWEGLMLVFNHIASYFVLGADLMIVLLWAKLIVMSKTNNLAKFVRQERIARYSITITLSVLAFLVVIFDVISSLPQTQDIYFWQNWLVYHTYYFTVLSGLISIGVLIFGVAVNCAFRHLPGFSVRTMIKISCVMVAVVLSIPVRAAMILYAVLEAYMFNNLTEMQFDIIIYTHYVVLELLPCLAIMYAIGQTTEKKISAETAAALSEPMKDLRTTLRSESQMAMIPNEYRDKTESTVSHTSYMPPDNV